MKNKLLNSVFLLLIFLVCSWGQVNAENFGLVSITAIITDPIFNGALIIDRDLGTSWWTATTKAVISSDINDDGRNSSKGLKISYDNYASDSWSIVGRNLNSGNPSVNCDLSIYKGVTFYVKGDLDSIRNSFFVIANDKLTNYNNYQARIINSIDQSNYDPNAFNKVTVYFDDFKAVNGFNQVSSFMSLIKEVQAIQFKNSGICNGSFMVDDIQFILAENPPYVPVFDLSMAYNLQSPTAWQIAGVNLDSILKNGYNNLEDNSAFWWTVKNTDGAGVAAEVNTVNARNYKGIELSLKGDLEQFKNVNLILANDEYTLNNNYGANLYDYINTGNYIAATYNKVIISFDDLIPRDTASAKDINAVLENIKALQLRVDGAVSGNFRVDNIALIYNDGLLFTAHPKYIAVAGLYNMESDKAVDWWTGGIASGNTVSVNIVDTGLQGSKALVINYQLVGTENILIGRNLVKSGMATDLTASYNEMVFWIDQNTDLTNLLVSISNDKLTSNNFVARVSDFVDTSVVSGNFYKVVIPFEQFRPGQLTGYIPQFSDLLVSASAVQLIVESTVTGSAGTIIVDNLQFVNDPLAKPVVAYDPAKSFDMETYLNYWFGAISSNVNSDTINTRVVNSGVGDSKAIAIDYNISAVSANAIDYAVVGRPFWTSTTNVSLVSYGSVSFYIKGSDAELQHLNFALINDKLTSVNYQAKVSDYLVTSPDVAGYSKVTIPFCAFIPMYLSDSQYTAAFTDIINNVNSLQFRLNVSGQGTILVDNLMFNVDTDLPQIALVDIPTLKFTPIDLGLTQTSSVGKLKSLSVGQVSKTKVGVGNRSLSVEIKINDSGLIVLNGITPNVWLEMTNTSRKLYMSSKDLYVSANIIRGKINIPAGFPCGTGNIYINPSFITDQAGNRALSSQVLLASVIYAGELMPPALASVQTNWDKTGRRVQIYNPFVVTINVTDPSGIDLSSIPVVSYVDKGNVTRSFTIGSPVVVSSTNVSWMVETGIDVTANIGSAKLYISGIKDIYANELVNNKIVFTITNGTPVNNILTSRIYINGKEVVTGDYVESVIKDTKIGFVNDMPMSSFNIMLTKVDGTAIATSSILPFTNTGNIMNGPTISYTSTADYTFASPVALNPGNYKLTIYGWDASQTTLSVSVIFSVTNTLLTQLLSAPNPFNPRKGDAHITYYLAEAANIELRIYSISGELLKSIKSDKNQNGGRPGFNELTWDGINKWNEEVSNGVYLGYLSVDTGSKKTKDKVKIAVLK